MKTKKGDTVELLECSTHPRHKFNSETGVVRTILENGIICLSDSASCGCEWFDLNEYKIISKKEVSMKRKYEFSKDGLRIGDFVINKVGDKAKILEVLENSFAKSDWEDFDGRVYWYQFKDAIREGWTIEQPVKSKSKALLKKIAEAKKQKVEIDKFLEEQGEM